MKDVVRLGYSIREVEQALHLSHQTVYNEINAGRLKTYRVGRRRFISHDALHQYVWDREQETPPSVGE